MQINVEIKRNDRRDVNSDSKLLSRADICVPQTSHLIIQIPSEECHTVLSE